MKRLNSKLTRRSAIKGTIAFVGSFSIAHQIPSFAASQNPIRLGHQCDLTGALASSGYWCKKASDAAVKWVNSNGGIAGRPLEIVTADSQTKVDVGVLRMRQMIQDDKVDFVLGTEHGGIALASAPVAKELNTIYIPVSRTDAVTGKGLNPHVFRIMVTASLTAKASAGFLVENIGKRWSILYADYAWGFAHRDALTKWITKSGGSVIKTQSMPIGAPDPFPYISKLDPSAVDGVCVALLAPDILRGFSALRQLGFAGKQIVGVDAVFGVADPLSLGELGEGIWSMDSTPWELKDLDTPNIRVMRDAIGIDEHGREVGTNKAAMMPDSWVSWENITFLKRNIEGSGWKSRDDNMKLIKYAEANPNYPEGKLFPQGPLYVRPEDHQAFCDYYMLQISDKRIRVRARIKKEEGIFPATVNVAS